MTFVNLPREPIMELVPSLSTSLSLRLPDEYNFLLIFIWETVSQDIGILICGIDFSGAEFTCHTACILFELQSIAVGLSREPVPPSPPVCVLLERKNQIRPRLRP